MFVCHNWQNCERRHRAAFTVFAEASVIPRAVFNFGLWIDVQEWTFLVATLTCNRDTQH